MTCVALKSASNQASDPAMLHGVRWLLDEVGESWGKLEARVRVDTEAQRAREAQQRRERAERVRKIREERERWVRGVGGTESALCELQLSVCKYTGRQHWRELSGGRRGRRRKKRRVMGSKTIPSNPFR